MSPFTDREESCSERYNSRSSLQIVPGLGEHANTAATEWPLILWHSGMPCSTNYLGEGGLLEGPLDVGEGTWNWVSLETEGKLLGPGGFWYSH